MRLRKRLWASWLRSWLRVNKFRSVRYIRQKNVGGQRSPLQYVCCNLKILINTDTRKGRTCETFCLLPFVLYHIAVCGDYSYCHGDIFAAVGDCFSYCVFYSATAWNLHSGYCYAADIVSFHYLAKLFGIVCGIKLRTAYDGYFACHEI